MKRSYVYIVSNWSRTIYIGVTNDLKRRIAEHKLKLIPGFTQKYNIAILVYFEEFHDIRDAIRREKQLKGWKRERKIKLIEALNHFWKTWVIRYRFFDGNNGVILRMTIV
jgi:putative endonuclease